MQTQPQEEIIKILPKGLITIPINFRKSLGIEENALARIREDKGRLILEPLRTLPYPVRKYTSTEIDEFMGLDKKESKKLRRKSSA